MAIYTYQAFSKDGKKITGKIDSLNSQAVRDLLSKQGLFVVSVTMQSSDYDEGFLNKIFGSKMNLKDKIFFTKQLALLLKSGIALTEALNLMVDQTPAYVRSMVIKMRDELKEGTSFAVALSKFPKNFSSLYIQLVRAGEASGQMDKVLIRLAGFLEEEEKFNASVKGALRKPLIELGLVLVVAGVMLTLIVPKIMVVFEGMQGVQIPTLTKVVMAISNAILKNYILIIAIVGSIIAIYNSWAATKSGKFLLDTIKLKIPVINFLNRMEAIVQFSQTLGLLLEAGVNIAEALDIVVQIVDNQVLVEGLKKARDNIIKQGKVTEYLSKTGLFSAVDIHLIGTGEQSGALDSMLNQVGSYNQNDLQEYAQGLSALLNPISMVILAGVVGTIILAVMGPIMNLMSMAG